MAAMGKQKLFKRIHATTEMLKIPNWNFDVGRFFTYTHTLFCGKYIAKAYLIKSKHISTDSFIVELWNFHRALNYILILILNFHYDFNSHL